ncbi:HEPN domain-containing protein [Candidatus Woesearchaeota archaeon]|nr:HEPN domain-containing protein [Candidatus Woesearchaeota archaeon]
MNKTRLPKTEKALERAYLACESKKKLRKIDNNTFSDYVIRSQKDIASADNDFKNEDYYWARIKAYQALFHMLNALLVKNLGYYSKDHSCILTALLKRNIITDEIASKLHLIIEDVSKDNPADSAITSEDAIQDIDDFRIQRNFALYKPKAWEEVTKKDIESELEKIKNNIRILAGLL